MVYFFRYPRYKEVAHGNGGELIGELFQDLLRTCGVKSTPTTVKNPQASALIECLHLTLADALRASIFEGDGWWLEIEHALQSIAGLFRTTISSTLPCSLGTLAFNHGTIVQTKAKVDWELIKKLKWNFMVKNNAKENSQRTNHQHAVGDLALIAKNKHEKNYKLEKTNRRSARNNCSPWKWQCYYLTRYLRRIKTHHNASEQES